MQLRHALRSSVLLSAILLFVSPSLGQQGGAELFEHLRGWFPADTEVVYVSNQPLHGLAGTGAGQTQDYAKLAGVVVAGLPDTREVRAIMGLEAASAMYIGRRFRVVKPHKDLVGRLEGCSFFRASESVVASALRATQGRRVASIRAVGVYRIGSPKADEAGFVAVPEPGMLMVCTEMSLTKDILQRRVRSSGASYHPDDLLWNSVDTGALAWALRRFLPGKTDPTSPLAPRSAIAQDYSDPGALGMTFVLRSESLASVTYLSTSPNATSVYEKTWHLQGVTSSRNGKQIITMDFDPRDTTKDAGFLLLMALLGLSITV